jgi:hypothetical protein
MNINSLKSNINIWLYILLFYILWDSRGMDFSISILPWTTLIIILILALAIFDFFTPELKYKNKEGFSVSKFILFIQLVFFTIGFFVWDRDLFLFTQKIEYRNIFNLLFVICIILSFIFIYRAKKIFLLITIIAFSILQLFTIFVSKETGIDTHLFLTTASKYFLSGNNPYLYNYPDIYNGKFVDLYGDKFYFNYWPINLYLTSISEFLFSEVRYIFVIFQIFTSYIIYKYFNSKISAVLWISNMIVFWINERAWIDGFVPLLLISSILLIEKKKILVASFLIGLVGSIKLYYIFLVPFFGLYFLYNKYRKALFYLILGFILPLIPFLLFNFDEFYFSTFKFISNTKIRPDSISLVSGLKRLYDIDISYFGTIFTLIFLFIGYIYSYYKKLNLIGLLKVINICFLVIFLFGKQAFCNYFYFNMFLFLLIYTLQNQENKLNYE